MPMFFTQQWRRETWESHERLGLASEPLSHTAGNQFYDADVQPDDRVYVVGLRDGALIVIGRMIVASRGDIIRGETRLECVFTQQEAEAHMQSDLGLWEADDHLIARPGSRLVPMRFDRILPMSEARGLVFESADDWSILLAEPSGKLSGQTLRTVRALTEESAHRLDAFIAEFDERYPLPDD